MSCEYKGYCVKVGETLIGWFQWVKNVELMDNIKKIKAQDFSHNMI